MYWQKRFDRENPDAEIETAMLEIRAKHKDFGYRRMLPVLREMGFAINKKKLQRLMKKLGLQVKSFSHRSRRYSSYKGTVGKVAKNLVHRRFYTSVAHQKITTDTTEFKYFETTENGNVITKKLYLDPFMDFYNSEILSYSISPRPTAQGIMNALQTAIDRTDDCQFRRTFHSDQGWGYQMKAYSYTLKENKIFQSMSRKGNCHDNSPIENFFGLLKQEMYYGNVYRSYDELKTAIERYIHYYNHARIKEKLNWKSPIQFREDAAKYPAA